MYCKHCGREIDDKSSFCMFCGKPQDNRISTSNGLVEFVTNRPVVSSYILWVIINVICLCRGDKVGEFYNLLYPRFFTREIGLTTNYFSLDYYLITDFIVYTLLIPLTMFLGCHYFKKATSIKYRVGWGVWFVCHIVMYNISNLLMQDYFFPFTDGRILIDWRRIYLDPLLFDYNAYDLSELVFYTMIIPIAYWGYLYYKDKKKKTNSI